MNCIILLFCLSIAFGDSIAIAQSAHSHLVPVAEACGCYDVPILQTGDTHTTGSEYRTVRNTNTPIYNSAIQAQYTNTPMTGKRITRMRRNRKLNPNQVANVIDIIYNVPKSKYSKMSRKNLEQINELNNLKYRLARLAKITRSTAELLSTLPMPSNRYMTNTYNGYTLPATDTPVYKNLNVYGTQNGYTEIL